MKIVLDNVGKKFRKDWVIRNFSISIEEKQTLAILGPNGSGKSTLLQIISGFTHPTEGKVCYWKNNNLISTHNIYEHVAIAAPYMELTERFTLLETLKLHNQLSGFTRNLNENDVVHLLKMNEHQDKFIGSFSSGQKMRIRLALAILSTADVVLLDEPLSNMDKLGAHWYLNLVQEFLNEKIVIVCSNDVQAEYQFCNLSIDTTKITGTTV